MKIISAEGNNVRNAVAAAKRLIGNPKLRIVNQTGGDDNLYRITLSSGDVVEVTVKQHNRCSAHLIEET